MYRYEKAFWEKGNLYVAGCDEAGRGPIAGPVVAAAVILNPSDLVEGLNDSKQLTEKRRNELKKEIEKRAVDYAVAFVFEEEIDQINIYEASRKAMNLALSKLKTSYQHVLTDAMPLLGLDVSHEAIIKGDQKSATIAAASILAKVARDKYMIEMANKYPNYGFEQHKGYPTKAHLHALKKYGVSPIHRKSYSPVKKLLDKQLSLDI